MIVGLTLAFLVFGERAGRAAGDLVAWQAGIQPENGPAAPAPDPAR